MDENFGFGIDWGKVGAGSASSQPQSLSAQYGVDWSKIPGSGAPKIGGVGGGAAKTPTGWFSMESAFGENGWAMPAIGGASALANAWLGFRSLSLANRQAANQEKWANMNWNRQTDLLNEYRSDRAIARNAGNPNLYSATATPLSQANGSTASQQPTTGYETLGSYSNNQQNQPRRNG